MSDVFISYARPDEPQAMRVADALRQQGFGVWRDERAITSGRIGTIGS